MAWMCTDDDKKLWKHMILEITMILRMDSDLFFIDIPNAMRIHDLS